VDDGETQGVLGGPDQIALRYKETCDWADLAALRINLWLIEGYRSLIAGLHGVLDAVDPSMSAPRFLALRDLYLAEGHRLIQGEIQRRGKTSSGSVTRLMDGLEQDGLITRVFNAKDRRTNYVELTPKGLVVCDHLIPAVARYSVDVCAGIEAGDREAFVRMLTLLARQAEPAGASLNA